MRKISFWLFVFAFASLSARAQDAATQQLIDQLNARIENLVDMQTTQGKKIADLEKKISDLQDKLNQPGGNNFASADDLKKLAEQVQEIDKKRQADNEAILKTLEKIDKALGVASSGRGAAPAVSNDNTPATNGAQKGFYYEIKQDDTVSAIAKAYRDQLHIKITADDILKANPGLDPKNMAVGKKIFIPQPQ